MRNRANIRKVAAAAAVIVSASWARADVTAFATEYDQYNHNRTVAEGALFNNDYNFNSQYFRGSGSGAGGVLRGQNGKLYFSTSDQGIVLGFQPGVVQS